MSPGTLRIPCKLSPISTSCAANTCWNGTIEIVDLLSEPERALQDEVMLTPMLVKLLPAPVRKFIGNLSQRESLLRALEIPI
jgi:circadian clock protein KaiB